MHLAQQCRSVIEKIAFGGTMLPQEFTIGLVEPESEVSVSLHGLGPSRDVTNHLTTACTAPLRLCVAFDKGECSEKSGHTIALKFYARGGAGSLLGEITLTFHSALATGSSQFVLFCVGGSTNYCLPRPRLWAHYVLQAYSQLQRNDPIDIRMTLREQRAAMVTFIRPHPLSLVSIGDRTVGNIFPMNLMGDLGAGYFGFALREKRLAAHLAERAGRLAVSSVPLAWCSVPFQLACNHQKESVDWTQLPFETNPSRTFAIPVPEFAVRVREIEIEHCHAIGSHRFFIGRIISDEAIGSDPQACIVHSFYQFWRVRGDKALLQASIAQDATNKQGSARVQPWRRLGSG